MDHDVSLEQSLQFRPAPSKKARSCEERAENAQSTHVQSLTLELTEGVDTLQLQRPSFTSLDSFLKQHTVQPKRILASIRKFAYNRTSINGEKVPRHWFNYSILLYLFVLLQCQRWIFFYKGF